MVISHFGHFHPEWASRHACGLSSPVWSTIFISRERIDAAIRPRWLSNKLPSTPDWPVFCECSRTRSHPGHVGDGHGSLQRPRDSGPHGKLLNLSIAQLYTLKQTPSCGTTGHTHRSCNTPPRPPPAPNFLLQLLKPGISSPDFLLNPYESG